MGHGGHARVYRATDEVLHRRVAVKLFTVDTPDERDRARRESEKRLLAALSHESLVTLFDARLDTDPAYLVMEFIDGPTLREVIGAAPLEPAAAARIAAELAEALQVIHAAGVVHRDIKPSNVMMRPSLTERGTDRAMLADFGIASLVDTTRVTATGTLVGTAAYLSPEQARGQRAAPASDIYSLGLLLLEALTGRRAFAEQTPHEALAARLARSPEIPSALPADWRGLLSAMTALDPQHRPDAAAVTRAAWRLTAADVGARPLPLPSPPTRTLVLDTPDSAPPPASQARGSTGRHWMWAVIAVVLLALAGGAIALALALARTPAPDPTAPPAPASSPAPASEPPSSETPPSEPAPSRAPASEAPVNDGGTGGSQPPAPDPQVSTPASDSPDDGPGQGGDKDKEKDKNEDKDKDKGGDG